LASKAIWIPAAIVPGIIIVFLWISAPTMEFSMYHSSDNGDFKTNTFSTVNVRQTIAHEDNRFNDWSQACFRIKNVGQQVQDQTKISASNFKVRITTNAICENCDAYTDYTELPPQAIVEPCKRIQVENNLEKVTFEISVNYDAIIPRSVTSTFFCEKTEERENRNDFLCSLESRM